MSIRLQCTLLLLTVAACGDDAETSATTSTTATNTSTVTGAMPTGTSADTSEPEPTGGTTSGTMSGTTGGTSTTGEPEPDPDLYHPAWNIAWYEEDRSPEAVAFDAVGDLVVLEQWETTGLRKVSTGGQELWKVQFACGHDMADYSLIRGWIAAAPDGDIVIGGHYDGACDLGSGPLDGAPADRQFFVARYSGNGQPRWTRAFGAVNGEYWDELGGVDVDAVGDVVLTGNFRGSIDFGGGPLMSLMPDTDDSFVAKLAGADGSHVWSRRIGSSEDMWDFPQGIDVDANGSVYALFWANGALDIAGQMVPGTDDDFWTVVVSFDSDGAYRFHRAERHGGFDQGLPNSLTVASDGTVAVFHYLNSGGTLSIDGDVYTGSEIGDLLMIRYSNDGTPLSVAIVATDLALITETYAAKSAAAGPSGGLVIAGQYGLAPGVGPYTLPNASGSMGQQGIYAAALANSGAPLWTWGIGDADNAYSISGMAARGDRFAMVGDFYTIDFGLGQLISPEDPYTSAYLVVFER